MATIDPKVVAQLTATHEAALAFVDDLEHIRRFLSINAPLARDVRSLSNELRRILIDNGGDLRKIAPPRIGKFTLTAPDLLPLEKAGRSDPWPFITGGVSDIFGISIDAWASENAHKPRNIAGFEPGRTVQLRLDGFLSQKVICYNGTWVSRRDVIAFVANVGHGVHSSGPREPSHELLRSIRHVATVSLVGDTPRLSFNPKAIRLDDKPLDVDRSAIDFVLLQLISASMYLVNSPDIKRLEEIIRSERIL